MNQQSHSQVSILRKPKLKDTCIPLFIAPLFTIARTWKQPRRPLTDEWIKKLWYIYPMEYYSAIKRNAFESVQMRWTNLEPIIQSEGSQKKKYKYRILMHTYESRKMALMNLFSGQQWRNRHREQANGPRGGEEGEREMYGESNMDIYNICRTYSQWEFAV